MALGFNNEQVIYYHMVAIQSVGLVWTYFAHPDFLVINVGSVPHIYPLILLSKWDLTPIIMLSSLRGGWLYASCSLCNHIMVIINQITASMSFAVTV